LSTETVVPARPGVLRSVLGPVKISASDDGETVEVKLPKDAPWNVLREINRHACLNGMSVQIDKTRITGAFRRLTFHVSSESKMNGRTRQECVHAGVLAGLGKSCFLHKEQIQEAEEVETEPELVRVA